MDAIRDAFGEAIPPVVATKGYFGEYAGGGSFQLVAALLAMRDQKVHASCGFEEGDPELCFVPVREAYAVALRHILVSSVSAGGGVVCAVVSREGA
jgi:3-oxoacyl-(acyl-carrier-protein) synthase